MVQFESGFGGGSAAEVDDCQGVWKMESLGGKVKENGVLENLLVCDGLGLGL